MSSAFYVVLREVSAPAYRDGIDFAGKALAFRYEEVVAPAEKELRLTPLISFVGVSSEEMEEVLGEDLPVVPERFFLAHDGLHTVSALVTHFLAHGTVDDEALVDELKQLQEILVSARKSGTTWHLSLDI